MLDIEKELKDKLLKFNDTLKKRYKNGSGFNITLLNLLEQHVGRLTKLSRLAPQQVAAIAPKGIVAVDGSINTAGSSYPHYVAVMRSMAQSTFACHEPIYKYEIYSPLFEDKDVDINAEVDGVPAAVQDENRRSAHMACLEIEAAIEAIERMAPSVLMMDGSLAQFRIKCRDTWEELYRLVLERDVLLIGVVEEIKTAIIKQALKDYLPDDMKDMYDRELIFGILSPGQMLAIDEDCLGQGKLGLAACFMRTSMDPHPIAMDMPAEQSDHMEDMAALVYALTPQDGRGIPLWLDMVDNQVRITNQMMEALIDEYIDADLRHRLLVAKRQNRDI
jgi:hypothetical protein